MTTGDFNWSEIEKSYDVLASILYFVFMAVSAILLLNLLIAMLNQSYTDIIDKARFEYSVEQASLILSYGTEKPKDPTSPPDLDKSVNRSRSGTETQISLSTGGLEIPPPPPAIPTIPDAPESPGLSRNRSEQSNLHEDDVMLEGGILLCKKCSGVDGHLTSCPRYQRRVNIVKKKKEKVGDQEKLPSSKEIIETQRIYSLAEQLLKEQANHFQQLMSQQQDRLKESLKEDLTRELMILTEKIVEKQNSRLLNVLGKIERRIPQNDFDYVYTS